MSGGMGCPGIYTLDCYCDNQGDTFAYVDGKLCDEHGHVYGEFPHEYLSELGATCRQDARKDGWKLDFTSDIYLCPKCNPRSKRFVKKG